MDLNMPEMNGQEVTHALKKLHSDNFIDLTDTKFILYSCLSNTMDLPQLRKDFDEVANKPIDIINLRKLLLKYGLI